MLKCEVTVSDKEKESGVNVHGPQKIALRNGESVRFVLNLGDGGIQERIIVTAYATSSGDFKGMLRIRPQEMYFREGFFDWLSKKLNNESLAFGWRPSGEPEIVQIRMGETKNVEAMINFTGA